MKKKIDQLRDMAASGDWSGAIRLAGTFHSLGAQRKAITQAKESICRPDFQRQLGRDPDALVCQGIAAMKEKWGL